MCRGDAVCRHGHLSRPGAARDGAAGVLVEGVGEDAHLGGVRRFRVIRDAPTQRQAANPPAQFVYLDDGGLTGLPRGQGAIANRLKNTRATHSGAFGSFVWAESEPRDAAREA
jgi:hypothetical protein